MVALGYRNSGSRDSSLGKRLALAYIIGYAVLSLIVLRLWYLQCLNGSYFRDQSENNRTRTLRMAAPRGSIYDRDGRLMVGNRPAFNVALMLEDVPDVEQTIEKLAEVSRRDVTELNAQLKSKRTQPFEPKVLIPDVTRAELARVKVNSYQLPGVIVNVEPLRTYPFDAMAAQIFGYVREISKNELGSRRKHYNRGDTIGKSGLEKVWEDELRGRAGFVRIEVDARGRRRQELGIADNAPGNDLYTTIDLDLQNAAEKALDGRPGAVIALDPRNGDVLTIVSSPSYNANLFAGAMQTAEWDAVQNNKNKPLNNRVMGETYPPGSTFKLMLAVAGLAEKKITPNTVFDCPGYYKFGRRRYRCHKRSGHGAVNLQKAIRESCNAYYYHLGTLLGISGIHKYATMFGFGRKTGIEIPGETQGINPSEDWKLKYYGERWYPGDTIPVSIGQGYLSVTPLQLAVAVSALANGGKVFRPRLVRKVVNEQQGITKQYEPELIDVLGVAEPILATLRRMSAEVVEHERGTGKRAALNGVRVGGKTGTAQVARLSSAKRGEEFEDHAWFVAFAPVEDPMIAIAVIVEHAGHGGVAAAPVAKEVMEVYFRKKGMLLPEDEEAEEKPKSLQTVRGLPAVASGGQTG